MKLSFKKLLVYSFLLILGYYLLTAILIYSYSKTDQTQKADAAIVLGTAVWGDEPSPVFRERIRHGIWLHQNNHVDYLIFTGGKGEGQKYSEAEVAKKYAMENGIPEDRIFFENQSRITDENLLFSKPILEKENFKKVLLVSDPLHMKRAMKIAEKHQIEAFSSPTSTSRYQSFPKKAGFALREAFFLIAFHLKQLFSL
ncbi:YdcF family protein [Moheibacter sp.]|uniref:YdcF family protein n=1 Tax=Moheibacter sp. TaxID=1965316 RepID=UPI003C7883B1